MKKTLAMHEERDKQHKADDGQAGAALPAYLLEREQVGARALGWGRFGAGWVGRYVCGCWRRQQQSRPCAGPGPPRPPRLPGPALLQVERAKVLSNTIKQKRKEKAGKWEVPLPKVRRFWRWSEAPRACRWPASTHPRPPYPSRCVAPSLTPCRPHPPTQVRPVAEDEMFKVLRTGKRKKKEWKRMVTKVRRRRPAEGVAGVVAARVVTGVPVVVPVVGAAWRGDEGGVAAV